MHVIRHISPAITWVGGSDRRLSRFENLFPIPRGVSYNSYLISDQKTALLDTADSSILQRFLENVSAALDGSPTTAQASSPCSSASPAFNWSATPRRSLCFRSSMTSRWTVAPSPFRTVRSSHSARIPCNFSLHQWCTGPRL